MPTIQNTSRGQVVQIWGKAYIRGTDGVWRPLALGEVVPQGAELLTEQDGIVMMAPADKPLPALAKTPVPPLDSAIAAVERGAAEDAPAAGLAGGGSGDLQPGLRIDRVVESVTTTTGASGAGATPFAFGRTTQSDPSGSAAASVNDAPQARDDSVSTVAGAPVTVAVLDNDSDADNDTLTVSNAVVDAALGTVVVNADGTLTFTAAPGVTGPVSITYTITDPSGAAASATVTVNVATAPNVTVDAPDLSNDSTPTITGSSNLPPGSSVRLTVTDALGATQVIDATVGIDGRYSVDVPAAMAEGPFTVTAHVDGPAGSSASASDSGSIDTLPPAPSLTLDADITADDVINAAEAGGSIAVTGSAGGDAQPGDIVTLVVNGQTFSGSVAADGRFSIAVSGAALAADSDSLVEASISSADAAGNIGTSSDSEAYAVDTTPPTATITLDAVSGDDLVDVGEAAGTITITGSVGGDVRSGDTVTLVVNNVIYSGVVQPDGSFAIAVAGSDVLADGNRRIDASVSTADAAGNPTTASAQRSYVINGAPIANDDSLVATEDTAVIYTAAQLIGNDTDAEGNVLTIASVTSGSGGTAVLNGDGTVTFTPTANFNGTADFTYTVTDGTVTSNTATVTVAVAAVNDAPVANNDSLTATEDTAVIYTAAQLLGNDTDADGNTLTIASVTSGAGGTAVLNGDGTVTFTPSSNFNGTADFTYTVTDGTLTSNTATVTVAVAAVNDAPVANNDSLTTTEDTAVIYTAAQLLGNDTDADGNTLTIAGVTSGSGGTAVLNANGTVTFRPNANFNGTADFTYTVTDGTVTSNPATVTVAVAAINDAPVAVNDSLTATEDTAVVYTASQLLGNDSDADGNALTIASVTSGAGGTAVLNGDGTVTFTPNANFNGTADFTYTVTDGTVTSNTATVTVAVAAVNDAPVANNDSLTATEDTAVIYTAAQLLGNDTDADGNALSIASVTSGAGGVAVLNGDGTVTFTPNANFNGTADFRYTVTDGALTSNTAPVTVTVAAVNDAPVANNDSLIATEDTAVIYTAAQLVGNDTDADGSTLTIASVTSGAGGTAVLNGDGTVTFTPNANFNGTADFTYTVTDGTVTSNVATVTRQLSPQSTTHRSPTTTSSWPPKTPPSPTPPLNSSATTPTPTAIR